jgi:hypothetical protein
VVGALQPLGRNVRQLELDVNLSTALAFDDALAFHRRANAEIQYEGFQLGSGCRETNPRTGFRDVRDHASKVFFSDDDLAGINPFSGLVFWIAGAHQVSLRRRQGASISNAAQTLGKYDV